jgi:hypothetical protein
MTNEKVTNIGINAELLIRVELLRPAHLSRRAFINDLIYQQVKALEQETRAAQ